MRVDHSVCSASSFLRRSSARLAASACCPNCGSTSDMERPVKPPTGSDGFCFCFQAGFPPQEGSRPFVSLTCTGPRSVPAGAARRDISRPERRAVVKGAPVFGAAKRTLDCEHRSGTPGPLDGRRSGNTFPLVGLERVLFWTAGPTTAQEHTRRLITLIFAGRYRMVMIRRELPRTKGAGCGRSRYRIEAREGSPFRGPCAAIGSAVQ
jgi:hypothetical protein